MDGQWVCLTISSLFHRSDKEAAASEIERIFGDDLKEIRIVCDDNMEQSGEYFTLVRCCNYHNHIEDLKESAAVLRVISSYTEPAFLSKEEVDSFAHSVDEEPPPEDFIYGDMVIIRDEVTPRNLQYLSGLYGIVAGFGKRQGWINVYFRFETRSFEYSISSTSLEFMGNVFENMCVPPFKSPMKRAGLLSKDLKGKAREAVKHLVSRDKIRRQQRRELERPYNLR